MNGSEASMQNIINYINSIPFEPEKYDQESKKKYYHNLSYYEIDYDVDKLNEAYLKTTYVRFLESKIKAEIKKCIIRNINELYKLVGFNKRFEELPTEEDYKNISDFSKFLNVYDLGYLDSEDNEFRYIVQEIVSTINYLHPVKGVEYKQELFSMHSLSLMPNEFDSLLGILKDYKEESEQLKKYSNWAEIYHSLN